MKTIIKLFKKRKISVVRRNVFKNVITLLLVLLTCQLSAQDQKTLLKQWGEGTLQEYTVSGKKGNYTYIGVSNDKYDIKLLNMDDPYLWGVKLATPRSTISYAEFHADNNAYAVSMRRGLVPHATLKYHMRYDERNEHRLLVVGDYIYLLEAWKSKDDFKIKRIFKKGRLKGLKLMKEMYAAKKKMEAVGHEEKLQAYLDKEYAIQAQKTPAWNKQHAKYLSDLKTETANWKKELKEERAVFNKKLSKIYAENEKRSGGGKSSSKSSSAKKVKVHISNKGSHGNIMVYWKEGGNWRHSGYSKGYSGIVIVPERAQLYYVENNSAKKPFFVAPKYGGGTKNYSF